MDRSRPRPGRSGRTGGLQCGRDRRSVLPAADFRHRRPSRPHAGRAQRDEPCSGPARDMGRGPGTDRPRNERVTDRGGLRRPAPLCRIRVRCRRSICGSGIYRNLDAHPCADAGRGVRRQKHERGRRCTDHGIAQPANRQRVQGVLPRRHADRLPHRPRHRNRHRRSAVRRRGSPRARRSLGF